MDDTQKTWLEYTLLADGISCRRGRRTVFESLSFTITPGTFVHLGGHNGSGKTSLLRLLAGLLPPERGNIVLSGEQLRTSDIPLSEAFLYSGHQHGLKRILSLRDNSNQYHRLMTGTSVEEQTLINAAQHFGLNGLMDQPLKFFSSGQTHRAALLRFMLISRPIWLMDEPTVGLDTKNRAQLQAMMENHLAKGGSIIAASHDPLGISGQEIDMAAVAPSVSEAQYWL